MMCSRFRFWVCASGETPNMRKNEGVTAEARTVSASPAPVIANWPLRYADTAARGLRARGQVEHGRLGERPGAVAGVCLSDLHQPFRRRIRQWLPQGWSNGAMTALVTMSDHAPGIENPNPQTGFRVALAEYLPAAEWRR